MTRRLLNTVTPLHNDKYYVYALFKPEDFNPFYIGKGIRGRINDHFKASNLVQNTPKTGIIKKYGNSIKREILVYFDKEEAAYVFEEYLISLYGLESEGGCLVNYAKNRFQYSDRFVKDVSSMGCVNRKRKYSSELILKALQMFYIERLTSGVVARKLGINENYLLYVLAGKKCKSDFETFVSLNQNIRNELEHIRSTLISHKRSQSGVTKGINVTDVVVREEFNNVLLGRKTVSQSARDIGMSVNALNQIFLGKSRPYLGLDCEAYRKTAIKGCTLLSKKTQESVKLLMDQGLSVVEIKDVTGFGRTTIYRAMKRLSTEVDGGSGNASDLNLDNKV